jgi:serine/threonine protein kinase
MTGTLLNQRYRIMRPLGKGGMGAVYEAVGLRLNNTVAVKRMIAEAAEANRHGLRHSQDTRGYQARSREHGGRR